MKRDGRTCSMLAAFGVAAVALSPLIIWGAADGGAAIVPPQNPSANISPSPTYDGPCAAALPASPTCPVGLAAIDADRQIEGVIPMSVPADFASLTAPEQVFVLANLERVDRGLPPIGGLASSLDSLAQTAAQDDDDPTFPSGVEAGGSNWAGSNVLTASELWMYDDGWNGSSTINEACTSPTASGCWGHRDNILGTYPSPSLMGAGVSTTSKVANSTAELFVGGDATDTPYFTWAQVTPTIPVGAFPPSVSAAAKVGSTDTTSLELWASGEAMNVTISIAGGNGAFSVTPLGCSLAAGTSCNVSVVYAPTTVAGATATLAVVGPNGTTDVTLAGAASPGTSTTVAGSSTTSTTAPATTATTSPPCVGSTGQAPTTTTTGSSQSSTTTTSTTAVPTTTSTTAVPCPATTSPPASAGTSSTTSDATSASADLTATTGSNLAFTGVGLGVFWAGFAGTVLLAIGVIGRREMTKRGRHTHSGG